MGSSGSGKFGSYRLGNGSSQEGAGGGSAGGSDGAVGRGSGEVECPRLIKNIRLEDVANSEYFIVYQSLPQSGESVELNKIVHNGRLVVKTSSDEIIGNLPIQYNYLLNCMKKGMHYTGEVVSSRMTPVPYIVVTLNG